MYDGKTDRSVKLISHLHLEQKLIMGVIPQLLHISVWKTSLILAFIVSLGALYGPLILHTLPPSMHYVTKAFKAITNKKTSALRNNLNLKPTVTKYAIKGPDLR